MQTSAPDTHNDLRDALRALCAQFPPEYHRQHGADETYPEEFVEALTREGWLAAMIPEEYGGSGLGLTEASIIMEEGNSLQIAEQAEAEGFRNLRTSALQKVARGMISLEEANRITVD